MKKIQILFAALFVASLLSAQGIDERNRQYLLEKLVFYYVDNPASAKPADLSTLEVDKIAISNNQSISSPLWTNANNEGLKTLLKKILCTAAQGGDLRLQRSIRNVLLISDKKVYVFLYNDVPNAAAHSSWIYCTNSASYGAAHSNASWPCASRFSNRTLEASGHIGIGAYFFSASRPAASGGWASEAEKGHVFIHELVHTQLPLVLEPSLGSVSMYGLGGHSFTEMIPSKNSAFNEGIATAFAFRYHLPDWAGMSAWFNNNDELFVDNISGCAAPPPLHCLQLRLAAVPVAAEASCSQSNAACYKIRNLTAPIIMYNENVSANILYQYMREFDSELMLIRDVKNAMTDMANAANYTFTPLFKQMVKSGMNYHNPRAPTGTVTHGQHLPLGILDYYTGYKVNSKATLESVLETTWAPTDTNIEDYFRSKRAVLIGFRANATTWSVGQQLDRFTEHLQVKISPATARPATTSTAPTGGGN